MRKTFLIILLFITTWLYGEDRFFLLPMGYDYVSLENQSYHNPALGVGYLLGKQDIPFDEVEKSFLALALYRPVIFSKDLFFGLPDYMHQAEILLDARINRYQLLFVFNSSSDKPIVGGINTFQTAAGWGYEIIRKPNVSFILGAAIAVTDFGITLPNDKPLYVFPLPLIRFGLDSYWFKLSFEFLSGPNLEFTIAPKERIRFTADMRMDYFRSIEDVICEFVLWYRLFDADHKLGDFAGIGIGFKNDSVDFSLSSDQSIKSFEIQNTSIFAAIDLSILTIQGGWIFDSRYLVNDKNTGSLGKGFYISVQGIIPIQKK